VNTVYVFWRHHLHFYCVLEQLPVVSSSAEGRVAPAVERHSMDVSCRVFRGPCRPFMSLVRIVGILNLVCGANSIIRPRDIRSGVHRWS
jgi:hypothetical protein